MTACPNRDCADAWWDRITTPMTTSWVGHTADGSMVTVILDGDGNLRMTTVPRGDVPTVQKLTLAPDHATRRTAKRLGAAS